MDKDNDKDKEGNFIKSCESPNKRNYKSVEIKSKMILNEDAGFLGVENISKVFKT